MSNTVEPCSEGWCDQDGRIDHDHQRYIGLWHGAHPGSNRPMTVQGLLIGNGQPHPELVIVDSEDLVQTAVVLSWPVLQTMVAELVDVQKRFAVGG